LKNFMCGFAARNFLRWTFGSHADKLLSLISPVHAAQPRYHLAVVGVLGVDLLHCPDGLRVTTPA
jgi:hypothetical protein